MPSSAMMDGPGGAAPQPGGNRFQDAFAQRPEKRAGVTPFLISTQPALPPRSPLRRSAESPLRLVKSG